MKLETKLLIALGGGVAVFLALRAVANKATSAAGTALQAVNPTSTNNLAYRGANAVLEAVTGQPEQTLGTWLYELFNGDEWAREQAKDQARREAQSELLRESRRNPFAGAVQGLEDQVISPFNVGP